MNKQDLAWFIKDNLDYTFVSGNEEYPAEVHIDYDDLAEKLQEYIKTIAVNTVRDFAEKVKTSIKADEDMYQQAEDCSLYPEDFVSKIDELLEEYDK